MIITKVRFKYNDPLKYERTFYFEGDSVTIQKVDEYLGSEIKRFEYTTSNFDYKSLCQAKTMLQAINVDEDFTILKDGSLRACYCLTQLGNIQFALYELIK